MCAYAVRRARLVLTLALCLSISHTASGQPNLELLGVTGGTLAEESSEAPAIRVCLTRDSGTGDQPSVEEVGVWDKRRLWPNGSTLQIRFLDGTDEQVKAVTKIAGTWCRFANLKFVYTRRFTTRSDIRIHFGGIAGSSRVGTGALQVPNDQQTMTLGDLSQRTILHEFGHALGLVHEHQNPTRSFKLDEDAVIKDMAQHNWPEKEVRDNILIPLTTPSYNSNVFDPESIMGYDIPKHWLAEGDPIPVATALSRRDRALIATLYPKPGSASSDPR